MELVDLMRNLNDSNYLLTTEEIHGSSDLQDQLTWTRFVVQRLVIPIVVIFGIFGNLMSIAVLTRRWMRSSTNYYLTALAIYDTLYLVFAATMSFANYQNITGGTWYSKYQYPIGKPLVDTFSNTGVWLTLTFTIERWLCVCHPMRGRLWCTPKKAKYIIISVCLSASLITFPEFFASRYQSEGFAGNFTSQVGPTTFAQSAAYQFGYVYTNQILFTFLPLVLLLIFNTLLIRAVFRAAKRRTSMVHYHARISKSSNNAHNNSTNSSTFRQEKNQKDQQKVTITLISVVVVFILCHAPQAILNMYLKYVEYTKCLTKNLEYTMKITGNVFNLLVMVNASINFVLYSTFNTKFRRTFKRISIRTYRRLQGRGGRGSNQENGNSMGSDSNSPYRDAVTVNQSTKFTKITSHSTDENLHRHLVVKRDTNKNGCHINPAAANALLKCSLSNNNKNNVGNRTSTRETATSPTVPTALLKNNTAINSSQENSKVLLPPLAQCEIFGEENGSIVCDEDEESAK